MQIGDKVVAVQNIEFGSGICKLGTKGVVSWSAPGIAHVVFEGFAEGRVVAVSPRNIRLETDPPTMGEKLRRLWAAR